AAPGRGRAGPWRSCESFRVDRDCREPGRGGTAEGEDAAPEFGGSHGVAQGGEEFASVADPFVGGRGGGFAGGECGRIHQHLELSGDRKSTRLNSSHVKITYAV